MLAGTRERFPQSEPLGAIGTTRPIPPNQRSDGVVYRTVRCVQIALGDFFGNSLFTESYGNGRVVTIAFSTTKIRNTLADERFATRA